MRRVSKGARVASATAVAALVTGAVLVPALASTKSSTNHGAKVAVPAPSLPLPAPSGTTTTTTASAPSVHASPASWALSAPRFAVGRALNVGVTMADGTVIRADVYYPTGLCPKAPCGDTPAADTAGYPVLLEQTPYGKGNLSQGFATGLTATDAPTMVSQGYVVIVSDVRGTGTSGGTWGLLDPAQATDGATLARWAANDLPNGAGISNVIPGLVVNKQVGLFGASYMGINEFLTVAALDASAGPNPVKAMFPIIAGNDLYRDTVTEGGLFNTEFSVAYVALVNSLDEANPAFDSLEGLEGSSSNGYLTPNAFISQLGAVPRTDLTHIGSVTQYDVPSLTNIETGGDQAYDANEGLGTSGYWAQRNPVNVLDNIVHDGIATFLVGGWNDLFQRGELMNYTGLQNAWHDATTGATESVTGPMAPDQPVSSKYQLLMGPWMHITAGSGLNLTADEMQWFDSWMAGPAAQPTTPMSTDTHTLHLYELGSGNWNGAQHTGNWVDATDWPIPDAAGTGYSATKFYFGPTGAGPPALSINRGTLTTTSPTDKTGSDRVLYVGVSNPCTVNVDQWGAGALEEPAAVAGSDFAFPCDKEDILYGTGPGALTYTTSPMSTDEVLGGPIDATVYASATTTETELVADIEEVSPQGDSVPLTTGALLGSLRAQDPSKNTPGDNGAPLTVWHPYTKESQKAVVPGQVTEYDLEVFPTFATIPAGWSLRITLSTADTPHIFPTPNELLHLLGGIYNVQRNSSAASFVNVPLVRASSFTAVCSPLVCSSSK